MATLVSALLNRALKGFRLYNNPDILALSMDASIASITYTGILSGWGPTTVLEVGSELMLVTEVDTENKLATVVRGWLDTTKASHTTGAPIYLNPKMMRSDLMDLINDCLEDMVGHDLYSTDVKSFTYDASLIGYDLVSGMVKVLRVDAETDSFSKQWDTVLDWTEVDNADTTDFPSGNALMFQRALPLGASIRVVYSKPFTPVTSETDDLEGGSGLKSYMTDLPYYFILNRLMVDAERRRSQIDTAHSHQRAQDSPPFLSLRTGEWYQARYLDRINSARARLRKETKVPMGTGYGS